MKSGDNNQNSKIEIVMYNAKEGSVKVQIGQGDQSMQYDFENRPGLPTIEM